MKKLSFYAIMLTLTTTAYAQFGGVKALTDTQTVANKFHVFEVGDGQRLISAYTAVDSLTASIEFKLPGASSLPTCNAGKKGLLLVNTTSSTLSFCNGTAWSTVAYDQDQDGLTTLIDTDDGTDFTAGDAAADHALSGKTFFTGASMTGTTGSMPNRGSVTFSTEGASVPAGYYSGGTIDVVAGGTGDGDAAGAQILAGYEAWNTSGSLVDGTMTNRGSPTFSSEGASVPSGYYSGGSIDVVAGGTGDGDAAGAQILGGYEAWNSSGGLVDGTMTNRGAITYSPGTSNQNVAVGYHSGGGTINGDGDLTAGNIKTGVNIFGVTGTYTGSSCSGTYAGNLSSCGTSYWLRRESYQTTERTKYCQNRGCTSFVSGSSATGAGQDYGDPYSGNVRCVGSNLPVYSQVVCN